MKKLSKIRTINIIYKLLRLLENKTDPFFLKNLGVLEGILLANGFLQYGGDIKYANIKYEEKKYIYFGPIITKNRKERYDEYIIRKAKQYIHQISD